ncbi:MAG: 3-deoxy-manno-octulosonate cytidylyltransferase [Gammaproteobacteria bacterium]
MSNVHIVIPSRLGSTRLPNKPLQKLGNKTLIERVYVNAKQSNISSIFIATDSEKILMETINFCDQVVLTNSNHLSGTDRIYELCCIQNFNSDDIIINLQGDEPFMPVQIINAMPEILDGYDVGTACVPISDEDEIKNPNNVKVCFAGKTALYFSRSVIPNNFTNANVTYYKHIGIYAYKVKTLELISKLKPSKLELSEKLEQLRFIDNGLHIAIKNFDVEAPLGIDTEEDLFKAQKLIP